MKIKVAKYLKNKACQYNAEICVCIGLAFIIFATFAINFIAGMYLSGGVFIVIGILFASKRR